LLVVVLVLLLGVLVLLLPLLATVLVVLAELELFSELELFPELRVEVVDAATMLDRLAARSGQLPVIPFVLSIRRTEATTCS